MSAKTFLALDSGKKVLRKGLVTSNGSSNDGDVVSLDTDGRLNPTVMPVGLMSAVILAKTSENVHSGDFVNLYESGNEFIVRKARADFEVPAHGFVLEAFNQGQIAEVWCETKNHQLVNVLQGGRYYLSATNPGKATLIPAQQAEGAISQYLGVGISTTKIDLELDDFIILAVSSKRGEPTPLEPDPVSPNPPPLFPFLPFVEAVGVRNDIVVTTGLVDISTTDSVVNKVNLLQDDGNYLPFVQTDLNVTSVPVVMY